MFLQNALETNKSFNSHVEILAQIQLPGAKSNEKHKNYVIYFPDSSVVGGEA